MGAKILGSQYRPKQRMLMQSVAILRRRYPVDIDSLQRLADIADRIEELAQFVDAPASIVSYGAASGTIVFVDPE